MVYSPMALDGRTMEIIQIVGAIVVGLVACVLPGLVAHWRRARAARVITTLTVVGLVVAVALRPAGGGVDVPWLIGCAVVWLALLAWALRGRQAGDAA